MSLSTDAAEARDRLDFWRHAVSRTFVPVEAAPPAGEAAPADFRGEIASDDLAEVQVSTITASAHTVRRTPALIDAADHDYYQLALQVSGVCVVEQDGRVTTLGRQDMMMLDTTRPYQMRFEADHQVLSFQFRRELMTLTPRQVAQLTATRLTGRQGVGALMAPMLTSVAASMRASGAALPGAPLAANILGLAHTLLAERLEQDPAPPSTAAGALLATIKADVEARLDGDDLSPDQIAARHHISTRYLHKLFETQGVTVSGWIRERRLEHCRRDLRDPTLAGHTVAAIGARWGLHDAAHFSRLFKAAYHLSPQEYRLGRLPRAD